MGTARYVAPIAPGLSMTGRLTFLPRTEPLRTEQLEGPGVAGWSGGLYNCAQPRAQAG